MTYTNWGGLRPVLLVTFETETIMNIEVSVQVNIIRKHGGDWLAPVRTDNLNALLAELRAEFPHADKFEFNVQVLDIKETSDD